MLVTELWSWGKCSNCGMVIWVSPPPTNPESQEQRAGCACSNSSLHNHDKLGDVWDDTFIESDMQAVLDVEELD